jgi:hypothetical protein
LNRPLNVESYKIDSSTVTECSDGRVSQRAELTLILSIKTFKIQNSSFLSFSYFDNEALFSFKLKGFLVKQNGQRLLA